jgi:hypothetical protein
LKNLKSGLQGYLVVIAFALRHLPRNFEFGFLRSKKTRQMGEHTVNCGLHLFGFSTDWKHRRSACVLIPGCCASQKHQAHHARRKTERADHSDPCEKALCRVHGITGFWDAASGRYQD